MRRPERSGRGAAFFDLDHTGRLDGPFCYGEGKAAEVRRLAAERGYVLRASTAYSDSVSDLPFLSSVGTAVAVNPDRQLREVAARRGWRVLQVSRPSRVTRRQPTTA